MTMLEEADLERMLTGVDGVPALDAAREVKALRVACEELRCQCDTMQTAMMKHQETAELLMHEKAEAQSRLGSILEALAGMVAAHA